MKNKNEALTAAMADYVADRNWTVSASDDWYGSGVIISPAVAFISAYDSDFVTEVSECCDYYCGDMFSDNQYGLPIRPASFISKSGYGMVVISYDDYGIHIRMGFEPPKTNE